MDPTVGTAEDWEGLAARPAEAAAAMTQAIASAAATIDPANATWGMLSASHPSRERMAGRWERYRAFGGLSLETAAEKKRWLPKGECEAKEDYALRLELTEHIGLSRAALKRMAGSLTKHAAKRDYSESLRARPGIPAPRNRDVLLAALERFDANVDGKGRSLHRWLVSVVPKALRMGLHLAEVTRDEERMGSTPILAQWDVEELLNWHVDPYDVPEWVVLHRRVRQSSDPFSTAQDQYLFRILTRTEGFELLFDAKKVDQAKGMAHVQAQLKPDEVRRWQHNVGLVPVVGLYACMAEPFEGESYIEGISRGDLRRFRLDSDQAMSSWKNGNPLLGLFTDQALEEIGVGLSFALKLDQEDRIESIGHDASGMNVRETLIERASRESLQDSGMDADAVAVGDGPGAARSGVSIAMSHATSEVPTLNSLTDELDAADALLHEIVVRYLLPDDYRVEGQDPELPVPPHVRLFDGRIARERRWDLMGAVDTAHLASLAERTVKSERFRREMAKSVVSQALVNPEEETLEEIYREIEEADYSDPEPPDFGDDFGGTDAVGGADDQDDDADDDDAA